MKTKLLEYVKASPLKNEDRFWLLSEERVEVRIPKKTLAEGLAILERIIPSRSSNPILTYLPIEFSTRGLILKGTNSEVDIEVTLPAEIVGEGQFLVPASTFIQIVRGMSGEMVELIVKDRLELSSGKFNTQLSTTTPEGYPELSFEVSGAEKISAQNLASAIAKVRYAASTEEYRAIFRGVQLEFGEVTLRSVASDGYRLARYEMPFPLHERKFVIPARSADEIVRVFKDVTGDISLSVMEGSLTLSGPALQMSVKLMEGEFPDYGRVIPQNFVMEVSLKVDQLRESLKRVALLSDKNNHRVNLLFDGELLTVDAEGDFGRGSDEIKITSSGESQLLVAYNAQYLIDALSNIEGDVKILLSGATSPTVIQNPNDAGYLAVVVPLRV